MKIRKVIVVGGGTAGWLSACHLAKKLQSHSDQGVEVCLIESADIPTIGVGEGTVPAIRRSLEYLGISETDFVRECDATFKQSIKFVDWVKNPVGANAGDYYHHVFDYPAIAPFNLTPYWLLDYQKKIPFVDAVSIQGKLCDLGLAPKNMTHPEYQGVANYAYHLDAAKFALLLTRHATSKLGVKHVLANVLEVNTDEQGNIASLVTDQGSYSADIYVDCSGFASLLLGQTLGVKFIEKKHQLFADTALAVQVPYESAEAPIPCYTVATAKEAGWIWDIGLFARRGTGYVYSSAHTSHDRAEQVLRDYLGHSADGFSVRRIPMQVGYREKFWYKNCVAIGLSQGFVEPLEATGLLVYDATARMLAEQFPATTDAIDITAKKFNQRAQYAWDRVIDFVKLHYLLSCRDDTDFWLDNRKQESVPDSLLERLEFWRHAVPTDYDFSSRMEIFNLENYLYVLYGMQFPTEIESVRYRYPDLQAASQLLEQQRVKFSRIASELIPHRELIKRIKQYGLQTI